jgi:hypothetical protein
VKQADNTKETKSREAGAKMLPPDTDEAPVVEKTANADEEPVEDDNDAPEEETEASAAGEVDEAPTEENVTDPDPSPSTPKAVPAGKNTKKPLAQKRDTTSGSSSISSTSSTSSSSSSSAPTTQLARMSGTHLSNESFNKLFSSTSKGEWDMPDDETDAELQERERPGRTLDERMLQNSKGDKQVLQRVLDENLYYDDLGKKGYLHITPNGHESVTRGIRGVCNMYMQAGYMSNCQLFAYV